jgi:hypothetical protein
MKIVIIKKNGSLVDLDWTKDIDLKNLYKKAGFRKDTDFAKRHTFKIKDEFVSVYSKNTGRANTENKYELPPPVDSDLYFGRLVIIKHSKEDPDLETCKNLTTEEWKNIYETLMGGFEDLDDEEESEEEYVAPEDLTKQGYKKDGFVVDDDVEEWEPSNNDTDDSLEGTEEEVDQEAESSNQKVGSESEDSSSVASTSDDELHEEIYDY